MSDIKANTTTPAPSPPITAQGTGGLTTAEAQARLKTAGRNAVEEEKPHPLKDLLKRFWAPIPWLLEATIILQLFLHEQVEAIVIGGLLVLNAGLSLIQEGRAQVALALLRQQLRVVARVRRDGQWRDVAAEELVPGDVVHLRQGTIVPADIRLNEGALLVDQSTLTGESAAVTVMPSKTTYAGSMVRNGQATGEITATGAQTFFGRTAELVRTAGAANRQEHEIVAVVRNLFVVNAGLVVLVVGYAHHAGMTLEFILPLLLSILLASIPVALPATFTLAAALGSVELARRGVLITRLNALHDIASMTVLCTDKTGTLTRNQAQVDTLWAAPGYSPTELLTAAALASDPSGQDPVDGAIIQAATERGWQPGQLERIDFKPFDPASKQAEALYRNGLGARPARPPQRYIKGAPALVAARVAAVSSSRTLSPTLSSTLSEPRSGSRALGRSGGAGKPEVTARWPDPSSVAVLRRVDRPTARPSPDKVADKVLDEVGAPWQAQAVAIAERGQRVLGVAQEIGQGLRFVGLLGLEDGVRPEAAGIIAAIRDAGIRVVMVTGDNAITARNVAAQVGIPGQVCSHDKLHGDLRDDALECGVFAGVFPEDKYRLVRGFQRRGQVVGMSGDGVNDAPALRQAEAGIAMANATDVAKSAAALVLTRPGLGGVVPAVETSRRVFQRVITYTLNMLIKKIEMMALLVIGFLLTWHKPLTPMLMVLILFLNDFLTMSLTTDRMDYSRRPNRWNTRGTLVAAIVLAACKLVFSLGTFLYGYYRLGLNAPHLRTLTFAALILSSQAGVYLLRERGHFWRSRPSGFLLASSAFGLAVTAGLVLTGLLMPAVAPSLLLTMAGAGMLYFASLDWVKVWLFGRLDLR